MFLATLLKVILIKYMRVYFSGIYSIPLVYISIMPDDTIFKKIYVFICWLCWVFIAVWAFLWLQRIRATL